MMQLSAYNLTYADANALTPFIATITKNAGITGVPELRELSGSCEWVIVGDYPLSTKEYVSEQLKILPLLQGAKCIGSGPLAFYVAHELKIKFIDIYRYCLTLDNFDVENVNNLIVKMQEHHDGVWGSVEVSPIDPFQFVTTVNSGLEMITIVRWKIPHYLSMEEYVQLRDRGVIEVGDVY